MKPRSWTNLDSTFVQCCGFVETCADAKMLVSNDHSAVREAALRFCFCCLTNTFALFHCSGSHSSPNQGGLVLRVAFKLGTRINAERQIPTHSAMTSQQCADNGDICHNCVNIITEAIQGFMLSPLAEGHGPIREMVKGKRRWQTRNNCNHVLNDNQSSQFGTSPSECYVCFRSSQLVQTAGPKQVTLSRSIRAWGYMYLEIADEAESQSVRFTLCFGDGKKSFTHSPDS